jgi:predicted PurR-regulated permease PerM
MTQNKVVCLLAIFAGVVLTGASGMFNGTPAYLVASVFILFGFGLAGLS